MDWDAHREFQKSLPSADGLNRLAKHLLRGGKVKRVKALGGGLGAATHEIDIENSRGNSLKIVLKRFSGRPLEARSEWERLKFATRIDVPTPDPLLIDTNGEFFQEEEALVMSRLPGRPNVVPSQLNNWLDQLAMSIVKIQQTSTGKLTATLKRPHNVDDWKPHSDLQNDPLAMKATDLVKKLLPGALSGPRLVAHCDFHPGNTIWFRGKLTGIIDWSSARRMPPSYDVAYCRADLAVLLGARAEDRFLKMYESFSGRSADDVALWDLVCGLNALSWSHMWAMAYREQGAAVTARQAKARSRVFVERALKTWGHG